VPDLRKKWGDLMEEKKFCPNCGDEMVYETIDLKGYLHCPSCGLFIEGVE
jgi:uncharacterized Zn finger protein